MIACAFTFRGSEISTASIFREDELEPCKKATLEMVWLNFLKLDSIQLSQCHPKCLSTSRSSICASGITRYQAVKYSQSKSSLSQWNLQNDTDMYFNAGTASPRSTPKTRYYSKIFIWFDVSESAPCCSRRQLRQTGSSGKKTSGPHYLQYVIHVKSFESKFPISTYWYWYTVDRRLQPAFESSKFFPHQPHLFFHLVLVAWCPCKLFMPVTLS